ncbi:cation-translocating P-type ATPase [Natronogracilivirga saccharolytica]|uniref:Cation-transporting P-type ATPase n=1 Tax=Natronogracilivirga saccharolytica TaxID=2812953 RepID=A0A8J7UX34_9BACT|nr:cation-transporting P-type ATPase [Natronogracilivirga saccharolytica]MBP3192879.1 cation-transporting P-type ATPase [Natronogracilivirga saccharolytica]
MTSKENKKAGNWHSLDKEEAVSALDTDPKKGLTSEEASKRLEKYGPNKLPEQKKRGPVMRLIMQFHDVLIYILIVAAVMTALMGHWIDTWVILAVVLINAVIGFVQEGKAEQALENLKKMLSLEAKVIRDGKEKTVEAEELVPGDVVLLESGDKIPADLRFTETNDFQVEESALTGESEPVTKTADPVSEDAVVADQASMGFNSTMATYGRAAGVVVETGGDTEIGKINQMMSEVEELTTPLLRQIKSFGKKLSVAILLMVVVMFAVGYIFHDFEIMELFLALIGLAVASIPEGLPAIVTITLALGVQTMASRNAIIRKLPSVETLGAVTVICSDKTGTLTKNEMTAKTIYVDGGFYQVEGSGYKPEGAIKKEGEEDALEEEEIKKNKLLGRLLQTSWLCNEATTEEKDGEWTVNGDPTDGALLTLAKKSGISTEDFEHLDSIPFESDHKYMATLHQNGDERMIFVKGAPERILEMSSAVWTSDGETSFNQEEMQSLTDDIAAKGERVIALAAKKVDDSVTEISREELEDNILLLGFVGIIDPPRPEAVEAVKKCKEAGIRVKMITGDHAITARAIGEQLGICEGKEAITGQDMEETSDEELVDMVTDYDVYARTTPEHKLRIVKALQKRDHVVAMTGDGVNDAPALKRSSVGVAMGIKGTEVTREAAEMVLADDNFASIARAVEEGRAIYDNLKKAILFLLPTNGAQALLIITAILLGITLPVTPVQILWVNMVTAVTLALALPFEPAEAGIMKRKPRHPDAPIIDLYFVWRLLFVSVIVGGLTLGTFYYLYLNGAENELARTAAINVLVLGQLFYLLSCRSLHNFAFGSGFFNNKALFPAIGVLAVLQLGFVYAPFMNTWFSTDSVNGIYWLWALAAGVLTFILVELEKFVFRSKAG